MKELAEHFLSLQIVDQVIPLDDLELSRQFGRFRFGAYKLSSARRSRF